DHLAEGRARARRPARRRGGRCEARGAASGRRRRRHEGHRLRGSDTRHAQDQRMLLMHKHTPGDLMPLPPRLHLTALLLGACAWWSPAAPAQTAAVATKTAAATAASVRPAAVNKEARTASATSTFGPCTRVDIAPAVQVSVGKSTVI